MSDVEQRTLWVRAGGRCTLCKAYLLEGGLTFQLVPLGEGAHIVGQKNAPGSPRGHHALPEAQRDTADNVLLACSGCHTEIDKAIVAKFMTVEKLRELKRAHEDQIRHQTGLTTDRRTTVLRVFGTVRGAEMTLSRDDAARAVIESGGRFPLFLPSYDQQGIEIDLRCIEGEPEGSDAYYEAAMRQIDAGFSERLLEGLRKDHIDHLSVFAIARLPLLVYLGSKLDDGIDTDLYQRHRRTGGWAWPPGTADTTFDVAEVRGGDAECSDAALITNLSGATPLKDLPQQLNAVPAYRLNMSDGAHEDVIATTEVLNRFETTVRKFMSGLETTRKPLQRLHIFGAMPVSAAVTFGRCMKARDLRPAIVLYDLTSDGGYRKVLEF